MTQSTYSTVWLEDLRFVYMEGWRDSAGQI